MSGRSPHVTVCPRYAAPAGAAFTVVAKSLRQRVVEGVPGEEIDTSKLEKIFLSLA